jgi:hypothetical protein
MKPKPGRKFEKNDFTLGDIWPPVRTLVTVTRPTPRSIASDFDVVSDQPDAAKTGQTKFALAATVAVR